MNDARAHAPILSQVAMPDVSTVSARAEWEPLFDRVARPHFPQSWIYGEAKRSQGWDVERLVFRAGEPLAIAQVLTKRAAGIPVVSRINRGPLFLGTPAPDARTAVLRALRRRWSFLRRGVLLLAPALDAGDDGARALRAAGFWQRGDFGWGSSLIDLTRPLDELQRRLIPQWRNKLRKAAGSVTLRIRTDPADCEWMIERHVENMRAKGFRDPSPGFVRAAISASPRDFMLLQALVDGEPHGAALIARFGRHAEYWLGWFDETARRAAAGNFLLWHTVMEMQRAGCRALDLGGFTVADRYGQFKRGMRGEEYRLAGEWLAL